nr:PREDICTED: signal peptide, CUB and EGF-like domain-containing protein 1 [Latimeria chalumnae]|eukprot:XP_014345039.1 PREDICTED: signal peptide, CUB and EGF-like domain-containing protein 1 [Latimeria chalumnae]
MTNPLPQQFKYYIQYSCYPGYTLSHGDIYSFCLYNGTWSGITPVCLEITPCSVNNGGCSQICKPNHLKQAECSCWEGFEQLEDERTCMDVNECSNGSHLCQQTCVNTFGFYKCSCQSGYLLAEDERSCVDKDECAVNNGGCMHHCDNTLGSYRCYCEPGFQLEKDRRSCRDIDECLLPIGMAACLFGCINTLGSFRCHCPEGYRMSARNKHCRDIDECAENNGRGPCAMECQNAPGSYRCSCSYGYQLAGDGRSCIAECPAGYRKQKNVTGGNSTHRPGEQCVVLLIDQGR